MWYLKTNTQQRSQKCKFVFVNFYFLGICCCYS